MILGFAKDLSMIGITLEKDLPNSNTLAGFPMKTLIQNCLLYTSPSPRDNDVSRMPSSA